MNKTYEAKTNAKGNRKKSGQRIFPFSLKYNVAQLIQTSYYVGQIHPMYQQNQNFADTRREKYNEKDFFKITYG